MEITARQFGRIEGVCYALAKLTERNDVGAVLVNTIKEQLDEIAMTDHYGELYSGDPAACDGQFMGYPTRAELCAYGREVIDGGAGLITATRLICEHFGWSQKNFAAATGLCESTVSDALRGRVGPKFKAVFAELFGHDGGASAGEDEE